MFVCDYDEGIPVCLCLFSSLLELSHCCHVALLFLGGERGGVTRCLHGKMRIVYFCFWVLVVVGFFVFIAFVS